MSEPKRKIELRVIPIKIEADFENRLYRGFCMVSSIRKVGTENISVTEVFQAQIPNGIDGFFRKRPERLQDAILDALLKNLWETRGRYIHLRRT